jgi:hypothetical protein
MEREALRQALDTLQFYSSVCNEDEQLTPAKTAIAKCKAALAQPAQERDFSCKVCGNKPNSDGELEHGKGCYTQDENGGGSEFISDAVTAPQPAQEPFGWYSARENEFMTHKIRKEHERLNSYTHINGDFDLALCTTSPKREWVGLTDDEAMQTWEGIIKYASGEMRVKDFARAIETKLKEKNNGK